MNEFVKEVVIYDKITGVIKSVQKSDVTDPITSDGYLFWNKVAQTRHFENIDLPKELNYQEVGMFYTIIRKNLIADNLLAVKVRGKNVPMNASEFASLMGVSDRYARKVIKSLVNSGVLASAKIKTNGTVNTWFVVNPLYCMKGRRLSYLLYKIFERDLDQYLNKYVTSEMKAKIIAKEELAND